MLVTAERRSSNLAEIHWKQTESPDVDGAWGSNLKIMNVLYFFIFIK